MSRNIEVASKDRNHTSSYGRSGYFDSQVRSSPDGKCKLSIEHKRGFNGYEVHALAGCREVIVPTLRFRFLATAGERLTAVT